MTTLSQTYNAIKRVEHELLDLFPVPRPVATVQVGTFDAATGEFTGLTTREELRPSPGGGRPRPVPQVPSVELNAVDVELVFRIRNAHGGVSLAVETWHGPDAFTETITAAPGSGSVAYRARRPDSVYWMLRSGDQVFSDQLFFNRPPAIGVGAFRIPALPVALVYDPPQGHEAKNTARRTQTFTLATKVGMSFSRATTITTQFLSPKELLDRLGQLISFVGNFPTPAGSDSTRGGMVDGFSRAKGSLEGFVTAFPNGTHSDVRAQERSSDHTLEIQVSESISLEPTLHLGPGKGDVIAYLKNARVIWLNTPQGVALTLLGSDRLVVSGVQFLRDVHARLEGTSGSDPETELDRPTIEALLRIDPLVAGRSLRRDPRFKHELTVELIAGASFSRTLSHTIQEVDTRVETEVQAHVEEESPGFLTLIGIGEPENRTIERKLTYSNSNELRQGQTIETELQLYAGAGDHYTVAIYFDRVFNTFAYRLIKPAVGGLVGRLRDANNRVMAHHSVTLLHARGQVVTFTDEAGRFHFRNGPTGALEAGTVSLIAGSARRDLDYMPSQPMEVDLQEIASTE
jgi:hypothetical protein